MSGPKYDQAHLVRLRFFAETWKARRRRGQSQAFVLKLSAAVREANACGRKSPESIMNNAV